MARARKRHLQQELRYPDKNGQRRGRRVGDKTKNKPGRKPNIKGRPGSPHKPRPELNGRHPVHVVLRVHRDVGSLRKRHMYKALREATLAVARREVFDAAVGAFRIVHVSIQRTHVHLLVEAGDKIALSRGMQGFQISFRSRRPSTSIASTARVPGSTSVAVASCFPIGSIRRSSRRRHRRVGRSRTC
jgi:hypothetical protein